MLPTSVYRVLLPLATLVSTSCMVPQTPTLPEATSAPLVGERCTAGTSPCRCVAPGESPGSPAEGHRRFEVLLPRNQGTRNAVVIEGLGAMVGDTSQPEDSCYYIDLPIGASPQVTYMAESENRDRGLTVGFSIREAGADGGWYGVLEQHCGSGQTPCRYESVEDWTSAVEGGHRFHDPCGSTSLDGMRVDGGLYNRHFTDAQLTFTLILSHDPPEGLPGSACADPAHAQ